MCGNILNFNKLDGEQYPQCGRELNVDIEWIYTARYIA